MRNPGPQSGLSDGATIRKGLLLNPYCRAWFCLQSLDSSIVLHGTVAQGTSKETINGFGSWGDH